MAEPKKTLPPELAKVLDDFVEGRINNLEMSIKDGLKGGKDAGVIESYRASM